MASAVTKLIRLMALVADATVDEPIEDYKAELRERGLDPSVEAERLRALMLDKVREAKEKADALEEFKSQRLFAKEKR